MNNKGNWKITQTNSQQLIKDDTGKIICTLPRLEEENAHLLATAPKLAEALEVSLATISRLYNELREASPLQYARLHNEEQLITKNFLQVLEEAKGDTIQTTLNNLLKG